MNEILFVRSFYVCYLTCGFIASTHAFNLPARAFNLLTRFFNLSTRAFNVATRSFSLLTREFEIATRGFELVTCRFYFSSLRQYYRFTFSVILVSFNPIKCIYDKTEIWFLMNRHASFMDGIIWQTSMYL